MKKIGFLFIFLLSTYNFTQCMKRGRQEEKSTEEMIAEGIELCKKSIQECQETQAQNQAGLERIYLRRQCVIKQIKMQPQTKVLTAKELEKEIRERLRDLKDKRELLEKKRINQENRKFIDQSCEFYAQTGGGKSDKEVKLLREGLEYMLQ